MRLAFLPRRRIPLHVGIVAAVLAVCLLLVGLDGWRTWQARAAAIADDKAGTANLARSLAQHAHDVVHVADLTASGLRERVEANGLSPGQVARLNRFAATRVAEVPALSGVEVFDAVGDRVTGEHDAAGRPINIADRPYFEYHRTHADRGVHVGDVIRARGDKQWSITVSRRIDAANGRFAGVAVARISVAFLQDFYRSFAPGHDGLITLTSMNGIVVARSEEAGSSVGADISSGTVFRGVATGRPAGSFRYVSVLDGVERLGSYRTIDGYPFFIIVAHELHEVLAGWQADAWLHLAVSLCAAAALAMAGRRFARQMRIGQRAERSYRLLADNSSDTIVCMGLDGIRSYASPAFTRLTGWSVEESVGVRCDNIIHPDDRQVLAGVQSRLLSGAEDQVTSCLRYIRKDGSVVWVEGRARMLRDANGDTQIISNVRDITDRRVAEDQVAVLNQELARQANTDGLTGLANRRRFDEALDQEWRRGAREETPLSLLMIDVDRFKLYNDRHGHQGGDACLRAVAAAMAQVARRPADLTARYGGEEFAILLPGVDAPGAAALAGRVAAAVRATGIAHEDNTPAGVATVSIGAATTMPSMAMGAPGLAALVAGADAALYEAKRSGRNRVVAQAGPATINVPGTAVPA